MKKLMFILVCLLALVRPAYAQSDTGPSGYFINLDLIKQINCSLPDNKGSQLGTAFYVGDRVLLTAAHVLEGTTSCSIDGVPVSVRYVDQKLDYAVIASTVSTPEYLSVSCMPFKKGEPYYALGYALGRDFVMQLLTGSTSVIDEPGFQGETRLVGKTFPGMSGGPIFDSQGRVVGMVNGGDRFGRASAISRELREMIVCK